MLKLLLYIAKLEQYKEKGQYTSAVNRPTIHVHNAKKKIIHRSPLLPRPGQPKRAEYAVSGLLAWLIAGEVQVRSPAGGGAVEDVAGPLRGGGASPAGF